MVSTLGFSTSSNFLVIYFYASYHLEHFMEEWRMLTHSLLQVIQSKTWPWYSTVLFPTGLYYLS